MEIIKTISESEIEEFKEFVSIPMLSKGRNYIEFPDKTGIYYKGNNSTENQKTEELK